MAEGIAGKIADIWAWLQVVFPFAGAFVAASWILCLVVEVLEGMTGGRNEKP